MNENAYSLVEQIDNYLTNEIVNGVGINIDFAESLPSGAVVFAQVASSIGDVKKNALKALRWINCAECIGAEAIVFPECFLVGYPFGDLVSKFPVIVDECAQWLDIIASKTKNVKVLVGFVEQDNATISKKYYSSIAVISAGKIEKIIRKTLLSDEKMFSDNKCFVPFDNADQNCVVEIGAKKGLVLIGNEFIQEASFRVLDEMITKAKPDFILNIGTEISRIQKERCNSALMSSIAQKYEIPFLFVNQAGATENFVYNGASRVFNNQGELVIKAKHLEENFVVYNLNEQVCKISAFEDIKNILEQKSFSLDYEKDLATIYKTLVFAVKNYFKTTGFKRAVLGLSGGLDSTVSAVILADAIGAENVLGVSMPSTITSEDSKNDAKILAQNLGIQFFEIPVKEMCDTTKNVFDGVFAQAEKKWDCRYKKSFTNDNIQARSRAMILWGIANEFDACLPIATSDKSELYMGYATINGDMSGGYAPLADVTKTKLFALAKWLNKNRMVKNAIPQSIIEKRPGAELAINPQTGKPLLAEEALMPYDFMDEVIWRIENKKQSVADMIDDEFLYEKNMRDLGTPVANEQKQEWLKKFFKRLSFALFKWQLMPPSPIVDICSINGVEYRQPVLSSQANYCRISYEEKLALANQLSQ